MFGLRHPQPVAVRFQTFKKGFQTMKSTMIKIATVAAFVALAGCTDLKPLQADIDSLKSQVGTLSSDVAALKADRTAANAASAARCRTDLRQLGELGCAGCLGQG